MFLLFTLLLIMLFVVFALFYVFIVVMDAIDPLTSKDLECVDGSGNGICDSFVIGQEKSIGNASTTAMALLKEAAH